MSPVLLMQDSSSNKGKKMENKYELATLAGGCFGVLKPFIYN